MINKPVISYNSENCTHCLICETDCPSLAVHINTGIIDNTCIKCGHCVAICPTNSLHYNNKPALSLHKNPVTPEMFQILSTQTRSYRQFENRKIENEIIEALVSNLSQCPSASNTRNLEVTIITDTQVIKSVNDETSKTLSNVFKKLTTGISQYFFRFLITESEAIKLKNYAKKFEIKHERGIEHITYSAPMIFVFHGKKLRTQNLSEDANIWATYTSLYARTFDIGSCFNGFILQAAKRNNTIKEIMNIPKDHFVYSCLLMGYPTVEYSNEVGRDIPKYTIR